ncbi:MAG TPA: nickel-dependent hydrogenase large subunit [Candidatus Norongarragalinales archaeon]|nr:nickel-dependent hydrogenase large subunit [Candidatus Norongarragalinales archaeon]
MHQDFDINLEHITKIEGHADLSLKVRQGEVEDVELKITENKRFYSQAVRGKPALNVAQLVSRICGTCSIAHLTCCLEAVENALKVEPSEQTKILRKLTTYGMYIRDHAMHLYMFSLPDVFKKDSIIEMADSHPELVDQAFQVKAAGNNMSKMVAGRAVHSTLPMVGGFAKVPDKEGAAKTVAELKAAREHLFQLMQIFKDCDFKFERETRYVCSGNKDYSYLGDEIISSEGVPVPKTHYLWHLQRVIIPYSTSTGFQFRGKEFMVGSLPRMNLKKDSLHKDTRRDATSYISLFPSKDIYNNNLAQAVETLHAIDHSIELLETTEFKPEKPVEVKEKSGTGVAAIEAPRGTLYYHIEIENSNVKEVELVIPTAQNQVNMGFDIKKLVEENIDRPKEEIEFEIEKLIRAYDPCMSCATHFLKVKWT